MQRNLKRYVTVLVALTIMISTTSCTTSSLVTDSAARLNYVKIIDTSSLTLSEKKDLAYNKCVIYKAKYGKLSKACERVIYQSR